MPLDAISPRRAIVAESIAPAWRRPLLQLAMAWSVLLALFAGTWAEMARQWWDISTYNHILLVPAIIAWLVWQRAGQLAKLTPQAWWPGIGLVAAALFLWLLGDISGTATASHLGVVAAAQAATIALLGPRVCAGLMFPLAYAFFLVPLGEELVPSLQMITAEITIALTHASGIPALIEGVFIDTPVGLFEVAEACSGVKFLIAMIALGALVSHVCFRSGIRRAAFMALAVTLPILANGVRAWGTIYIAQTQGIAFAAGVDHIVYGWVFFAIVMAILLALGWRFFDRNVDDPFINGERIVAAKWPVWLERWKARGWSVTAGIGVAALGILLWSGDARSVEAGLPSEIALPQVNGWVRAAPQHSYPWVPQVTGADRLVSGSYRNESGQLVDVVFALYGAQEDGREAGAFGEGALPPGTEWRWLEAVPAPDGAHGERLKALGSHQRVAYTWYRHGEWTGSSRARLKLRNMADRLLSTPQPTMMILISAEDTPAGTARDALSSFVRSTAPLPEWMDAVAGLD
ncbi:exosortase A [Aurantiacibacter poecillastricola]|uniref:exosortase A n=1 Tax=Aurantiacibacter poecillastricola TaxID=3064385 RepID=UPI00273E204C|nr:exosortase A [Aurantiacibacter sp. 219JJ12-13]MDP5262157.1 exosortase A [Aurantiacibacter sp. 219JJ12-13]